MAILLASLALSFSPQISTSPIEIGRGAYGCRDLEVVDLDGDGTLDVLAASPDDGRLVLLRGSAVDHGQFGRPETLRAGLSGVDSIAVADFDNDGELDVAVADADNGILSWHPGVGGGALGPGQVIDAAAPGVRDVLAGDLDGDGVLDLAALVDGVAAPVIWSGAVGGAFGPASALTPFNASADTMLHLRAADLDGNGRADLVCFDSVNQLVLAYIAVAGGAFSAPGVVGATNPNVDGLQLGDINNDGDMDVVCATQFQLFTFLGDGTPSIAWSPLPVLGGTYGGLELADINADGQLDVLTRFESNDLFILRGQGANGFFPVSTVLRSTGQGQFLSAATLPRAGGGDDLVAATEGSVQFAALDTFPAPADQVVLSERVELATSAVADFNGDGEPDLISSNGFLLQLRLGEGGGAFGPPMDWSGPQTSREPLIGADFDGDGIDDVAYTVDAATTFDRRLEWRRGAPGGLGPAQVVDPTLDPLSAVEVPIMRAADVDGDGATDLLLTVKRGTNRTTGYYAGGPGGLDSTFRPLRENFDLADADDVNGDGRPDLMLVRRLDGATLYIESDPAGSGYQPQVLVVGRTRGLARFLDVDDDGDLDMIRSTREISLAEGDIEWFERAGASYDTAPRLLLADVGASVHGEAIDLDGDGDRDFLCGLRRFPGPGQSLVSELVALINEGGASWSHGGVVDGRFRSAPVVILADLDRDGNDDVLTGGDGNLVTGLPGIPFDIARWYEFTGRIDDPVCGGVPNSTGVAAELEIGGSDIAGENRIALSATSLPAQTFTLFAMSRTPDLVPGAGGSQGDLCLGGSIGRFVGPGQIQASNAAGRVFLSVDLTSLPASAGATMAVAGETLHFQGWYRDVNPVATSNFTSGRSVTLR